MKKKINPVFIFLLVVLAIAGILYFLGMHETFGVAGMAVIAIVLTFVIIFFVSQ